MFSLALVNLLLLHVDPSSPVPEAAAMTEPPVTLTTQGLVAQVPVAIPPGFMATESGAMYSEIPTSIEFGSNNNHWWFCPPPGRRLTRCSIVRSSPANSSSMGDGSVVFPDQPNGDPLCCIMDEQVTNGTGDITVTSTLTAIYDDGTTETLPEYDYTVTGAPDPPPPEPDPPAIPPEQVAAIAQAQAGQVEAQNTAEWFDALQMPADAATDLAVANRWAAEYTRWIGIAEVFCNAAPASHECTVADDTQANMHHTRYAFNVYLNTGNPQAIDDHDCIASRYDDWGAENAGKSFADGWTVMGNPNVYC